MVYERFTSCPKCDEPGLRFDKHCPCSHPLYWLECPIEDYHAVLSDRCLSPDASYGQSLERRLGIAEEKLRRATKHLKELRSRHNQLLNSEW